MSIIQNHGYFTSAKPHVESRTTVYAPMFISRYLRLLVSSFTTLVQLNYNMENHKVIAQIKYKDVTQFLSQRSISD